MEKILLAGVKGQEGSCRRLGCLQHTSVMALYPDPEWYIDRGILK